MKKNKLAPIIIFTYNRYKHFEITLKSLSKNYLSKESELYIFCDGPKNLSDKKNISRIYNLYLLNKSFKKKKIILRKKNIGLKKNITQGVSQILKDYDSVIVLEDDMISSKYFLTYMNEGLKKFKNYSKVASIHAYMYPLKKKFKDKYFFLKGADCWGWGTWKRSWKKLSLNSKKLSIKIKKNNLVEEFNYNNSYNYFKMLKKNIKTNRSWAICWYASMFLQNMYTLNPTTSLIKNIGLDGSGTNCKIDYQMNSKFLNKYHKIANIDLKENNQIKDEIKIFFKDNLNKGIFQKILKIIK